ncbi:MAG: SDR family NAD(P)-dependent oxidoreductase [Limisphaerales bacterium]
MDLRLSNQTAVVFGGANGIGRAIAEAFAQEGAQLCIFDRSDAPQDLNARSSFSGDVTDFQQVQQACKQFQEACGELHHVIYAVGIGSGKFGFPFWNLEPGDWHRIIDVNLVGAVNAAQACVPSLTEQRQGTLLFITSVAGQIGSPTDPPYSAAKAGLINFMQCAAKDFAKFNVRANCLSPGMVKTALNESVWAAGQKNLPESERQTYEEWAESKIQVIAPLGRWQTPPEFAAMATYLASDHARNITGQTINIDGGQVMHS